MSKAPQLLGGRVPPKSRSEQEAFRRPGLPAKVECSALFQRHHDLVTKISSLLFEKKVAESRLPLIRQELREISARSELGSLLVETIQELYEPSPGSASERTERLSSKRRRLEELRPISLEELEKSLGSKEDAAEVRERLDKRAQARPGQGQMSKSARRREKLKAKVAQSAKKAEPGTEVQIPDPEAPGTSAQAGLEKPA